MTHYIESRRLQAQNSRAEPTVPPTKKAKQPHSKEQETTEEKECEPGRKFGTAKYKVNMCRRKSRSAFLANTGFTINVPMRVTFYATFVICVSRQPVLIGL